MLLNRNLFLLVGLISAVPSLARAAEPTAMVEEAPAAIEIAPFDYLMSGQKITLRPGDRIVIDYFGSCVRETITGGFVIVGTSMSKVGHGKVSREHVACDAKLLHKGDGTGDAAVVVFRNSLRPQPGRRVDVKHRIYALCPLINLAGIPRVTIERLDQAKKPVTIEVASNRLSGGGFYDFADGPCDFVAGGTYRLTAGRRSLIFVVDANAQSTTGPAISRILRF
jgi:hypothetical protein